MKVNSWRKTLEKRWRGRGGAFPLGTLLFYGPDDRHATKVVASVFLYDGAEPVMAKWFSEGMDVRLDPRIGRAVTAFFEAHHPRQVGMTQGLAGCPHEEGIDYPDGEACPQCPFWADKDRWAIADQPPIPPGPMSN